MIAARNPLSPTPAKPENLPVFDAPAADPFLALIEAHRAAYLAWDAASDIVDDLAPGDAGRAEAERAMLDASERHRAAFDALAGTPPIEPVHLVRLTEHLRWFLGEETGHRPQMADTVKDGALATLLAGLEAVAPVLTPHPDAALLALGVPFLAAWRDEGAADPALNSDGSSRGKFAQAHVHCTVLADCIAALPATTIEGLGIKALVLACYSSLIGSPAAPMPEPHDSSIASDDGLLWQIQAGAARILSGDAGVGAGPVAEDAQALALIDAIEREWSGSAHLLDANGPDDEATDAALDRRDALIDAAERLPATSPVARRAKAMALAWIMAADLLEQEAPRETYGMDGRLAFDIAASLTTAGTVTEAGR